MYLSREDYVSNGGLLFKAFAMLFWSPWFTWYCLSSYWSLLILLKWEKKISLDQPGVSPCGEGICWDRFISATWLPWYPRMEKSQPVEINRLLRLEHSLWLHSFFLFCLCLWSGEENFRILRYEACQTGKPIESLTSSVLPPFYLLTENGCLSPRGKKLLLGTYFLGSLLILLASGASLPDIAIGTPLWSWRVWTC